MTSFGLALGGVVLVTVDAFPGRPFEGRVTEVGRLNPGMPADDVVATD